MTGTGNELAVREGVVITPAERAGAATALAEAGSIHSWLVVMKDVTLLAEHICDTAFVPKAIRGNAPAVAAAILAGMELDLPPMTALRHVQVVEGSPGLSAEYKRARVLAAGHKLDITEHTTEACTVTGHRKGHESVTVRYTIGDARRAGLVKDRGAYMTRPRRMLFARACTEVVDALFTDLTNGLATAELLEEEAQEETREAAAARPQRVTAADARARAPQAVTAEVVTPDASPAGGQPDHPVPAASPAPPEGPAGEARDPGPGPDDPAWQRALKAAQAQFKRFTGDDQAARLDYARRILRVSEVLSFNDLTIEELRQIGEVLSGLKDRAALDALLSGGEVHGGE